jgi:hypothetical protein
LAASRASQAQLKAVQAQADLRALQLAQGFLISVPGGQLVPGDQLVVTLMPLLKPRLLPKLLVLWVPALRVRATPVPELVARLLASSVKVLKLAKVRLLDLELALAREAELELALVATPVLEAQQALAVRLALAVLPELALAEMPV